MNEKNMQGMVAALAIVAILVAGFASTAAFANPVDTDVLAQEEGGLLEVTGSYSLTADPDMAEITLGYEATGDTAAEAQNAVADTMAAIRAALALKGVSSSDMETVRYDVYQKYNWADERQMPNGYTAVQMIKVTTKDTAKVGALIDAASAAGANRVNNIAFGLTDEKRAELKKQALTNAVKSAREQADAMANGLNVKVTGVKKISTANYDYQPYPYYMDSFATAGAESAPTQIDPQGVQVSASVSVTFSFV